MTTPFQELFSFDGGYYPNQGLVGGERVPNTLIEGSKNVWVEGPNRVRSWNGALAYASYGNTIMGLLGNQIYTLSSGSACLYRSGTIFYVGSGSLVTGTTSGTTQGTASSSLSIVLGPGNIVNAGITVGTSEVPGVSVSTENASQIQPGVYSVKYTLSRLSTGAESNGTVASANITLDGTKKLRITFPNQSVFSRNIYISKRGFPQGPWFKVPSSAPLVSPYVKDTSSSPVILPLNGLSPLVVDVDIRDGDLLDINPPLDYDAPLAATHVFALGDIIILVGGLGGGGVQFSKPGKPEAFPPDFVTFLTPNEPVLGIRGRPADGWQYVFCRNSLHAVLLTGDDLVPVTTRAIWSETGIANPNAASFVGGEFYGYSGRRGALRTTAGNQTAEPDVTFAIPIESDMQSWVPANVVVGYSQDDDCVVYFHGNQAWPYKRKLGKWSAPFTLADGGASGNVTSCVTFQGKLIFSIGSSMFEFSGGSTVTPWTIVPQWREPGQGYYSTLTGYRTAFDVGTATLRQEILTNFNTAMVKDTFNVTGANAGYTLWRKKNIKNIKSFTIRYSSSGANHYVYESNAIGGITRMRT